MCSFIVARSDQAPVPNSPPHLVLHVTEPEDSTKGRTGNDAVVLAGIVLPCGSLLRCRRGCPKSGRQCRRSKPPKPMSRPARRSKPTGFAIDGRPLVQGAFSSAIFRPRHLHQRNSVRLSSCRECCGNSLAACSGHVRFRFLRRRGQEAWARSGETRSPSHRPCASGSGRRRAAPTAAWALSLRRAARSGS